MWDGVQVVEDVMCVYVRVEEIWSQLNIRRLLWVR